MGEGRRFFDELGHAIAHALGGIVCDPRCGEHLWPVCGCSDRAVNIWGETIPSSPCPVEER